MRVVYSVECFVYCAGVAAAVEALTAGRKRIENPLNSVGNSILIVCHKSDITQSDQFTASPSSILTFRIKFPVSQSNQWKMDKSQNAWGISLSLTHASIFISREPLAYR